MPAPSLFQLGRTALGLAVAGSGLMQVVNGTMVRLGPGEAARPLALGVGGALVVMGGALLWPKTARAAALVLVLLLVALFAGKSVPDILSNPGAGFMWTNPAKVLALAGGAWILLARSPGPWLAGLNRGSAVAPWLLGAFLVICGVQHLVYAGFVDGLVPAWMPPGPRFWTYFSAVALVTGGVGVVIARVRRPAGLLSGLMIFLWIPLVHVALALQQRNAFELAGCFEALALMGVAWLVAATDPSAPNNECVSRS